MDIPEKVKAVLSRLEESGHEGYIVGGSLRNILLGKAPHDWDVTTSALPGQTLATFADYRVIETGLKHGTVTVLSGGMPVEVTTFRIDGNYTDSRHPDNVIFTPSLEKDLERRDFTVNAMAYSEKRGIVDLFGGKDDCLKGIIRCVGNAETRFREDALRILRAFRFMSELGFTIDKVTLDAAQKCRESLGEISRERIYSELCRTLLGVKASEAVELMYEYRVLDYVIPCCNENFKKSIQLINSLPPHLCVRLAALVCGMDESTAEKALISLKMKNTDKAATKKLIQVRNFDFRTSTAYAVNFLRRYGELATDALALADALGSKTSDFRVLLTQVQKMSPPLKISDLAVNGTEIANNLGISGSKIGDVLNFLFELTANEPQANTKRKMLAAAIEYVTTLEN